MRTPDLLADGFGRIHDTVHRVLDGIRDDELTYRADPEANTVAWLVWHLTRVQDDHVAEVADHDQIWLTGWQERAGLPFSPRDTGYGHSAADVAAVDVPAALLVGYFDEVHDRTLEFVRTLDDEALDAVVDTRWNPPVTLGVRLLSVLNDDLQHAGQAAFVKGLAARAR